MDISAMQTVNVDTQFDFQILIMSFMIFIDFPSIEREDTTKTEFHSI